MPTYIKTGFWEQASKGNDRWLNLELWLASKGGGASDAVDDVIVEGVIDKAPSQNIVYKSLQTKQNLPTGFVTGLQLSKTSGVSNQFDIAIGGFVITDFADILNVKTKIVKIETPIIGIVPQFLTTSVASYIALDINKNVIQSASPFTNDDRRILCILGSVVHEDLLTINTVNEIKAPVVAPSNQLHDFIKELGFLNLNGNKFEPKAGAANLSMQKSAGRIWGLGINANNYTNPHVLTVVEQLTVQFKVRKSVFPPIDTVLMSNLAPQLRWENVTLPGNPLTSLAATEFGIFHGTLFQNGDVRLQYPQNVYTSMDEAVKNLEIEPYVVEKNIGDNGIFRFYLIVKGGTTNFSVPANFKFIDVGKFGNIVGNSGAALTLASIISTLGYTPENVSNKQNSLVVDGSGVKYPTVDAVNAQFTAINGAFLHTSGNETKTGILTFVNTGTGFINGIDFANNGTTLTSKAVNISNTATGIGLNLSNSSTGTGIAVLNTEGGKGIEITNASTGTALDINSNTAATGLPFAIRKNSVLNFSIADTGIATGQPGVAANDLTTLGQIPDIVNAQIEVGATGNALATWNGKTVIFTANCTITIPAVLPGSYTFNGLTLAGVTVAWAISAPKTWLWGVPGPTGEKSIFTLTQRGITDSIILAM